MNNLTKADRIGHLVLMARSNADYCRSSMLNESFGYICQLEKIAAAGGFITAGTEEALGLTSAATDLIRTAQALLELRNKLLANDKPVQLRAVS
jgi:hypothetical protein